MPDIWEADGDSWPALGIANCLWSGFYKLGNIVWVGKILDKGDLESIDSLFSSTSEMGGVSSDSEG